MKLNEAISHAIKAHKGQTDKSGEPYIEHVLRVVREVANDKDHILPKISFEFGGEDYLVVAALHDVREDNYNYFIKEIIAPQELFIPSNQYDAVYAVSRLPNLFLPGKKQKYSEYIEQCCGNPIATVVKYYDILDHLRPEGIHNIDRSLILRYQEAKEYIKHHVSTSKKII